MRSKIDIRILASFILAAVILGCSESSHKSDAYGNFEATEIIVSGEATGKLKNFEVAEGNVVNADNHLGFIDTTQLYLQKQQLIYSIGALKSKTQDVGIQINVLLEQKNNLQRERNRIKNLLKDGAATTKQLDDINGEIEVVDKRILATQSQLTTTNSGILSEIAPLEAQIELINDKLAKSYITSPVSGTVLTKYAEEGEFVSMGQPLFKIANLDEMELRIYVSGDQLGIFKVGSEIEVLVDDGKEAYRSLRGTITWVSAQAEFTPKVIQTKEERVNLVYAVKVSVLNTDGSLKIGMPGEVKFNPVSN